MLVEWKILFGWRQVLLFGRGHVLLLLSRVVLQNFFFSDLGVCARLGGGSFTPRENYNSWRSKLGAAGGSGSGLWRRIEAGAGGRR